MNAAASSAASRRQVLRCALLHVCGGCMFLTCPSLPRGDGTNPTDRLQLVLSCGVIVTTAGMAHLVKSMPAAESEASWQPIPTTDDWTETL
eukprot:SAG22_NODE_649_length_8157_cov_30.400099_1_plen_91_part_00